MLNDKGHSLQPSSSLLLLYVPYTLRTLIKLTLSLKKQRLDASSLGELKVVAFNLIAFLLWAASRPGRIASRQSPLDISIEGLEVDQHRGLRGM